jgi:hypothetical protein
MPSLQSSDARHGGPGWSRRLGLVLSCAATLSLLAVGAPAHGVTFTIDDVGDAVDAMPGDGLCQTVTGVCTLRAAIQEANALPGADRIECQDKLEGVVVLAIPGAGEDLGATGDLDVRDDVEIDGDCERQYAEISVPLQVDAAGLDRVLHVVSGAVTIRNIQLVGGVAGPGENGGGILNEADLTLDAPFVFVTGNAAGGDGGGLYNAGTTSTSGTSFEGNTAAGTGGGIVNDGVLDMMASPVSGNTATSGGGIDNRGTLTASRQPINGNHATAGAGGGVLNATGATVYLGNSTVAGNTATAGADGLENLGAADLRSVTVIDHDTLGVRNDDGGGASLLVTNTVLGDACAGTITSAGWNLTASCVLAGDPTGNHIGVDPDVDGQLTCNTVAWCPYYRPLPGSPLIDAGNPAGCFDHLGGSFGLDQRGSYRQRGAACDIGAVESVAACEGGLPMSAAQLIVSGLGAGPGRQKIVFSGKVPVSPAFDLPNPFARGAQIALDDLGAGASLYERSQFVGNPLPGGGSIPFSCYQWRGKGTTYIYREVTRNCPAPASNGRVRRLRIQDHRTVSPSEIRVVYRVTDATVPVPVGPIRSSVTFGATAILSALGRCGEHTFLPAACQLNGSKLKCRDP